MKQTMYLVDVSSMIFRAFYSIRNLTNPQGLPVNAIYGFLAMVIKLLKDHKPNYLVFCYDRKEPSFRKELYSDYKANRTEMPEDLAKQMPYIMKIAPLLGIPALEVAGYEADDIIGTLVRIGLMHDLEVTIVSGDKDFGQLIQPHVSMLDTMKDIRYDREKVIEKWGVPPEQFIDFLAIVGDSSDHIPGVNGIGPKGAIKLLNQFQSLEKIYEHIDEIQGASLREKLMTSKQQAFLARKLVTIVHDVPVSTDLDFYRCRSFDVPGLRDFLKELNFKTFEKVLLDGEVNHFASLSVPPSVVINSPTIPPPKIEETQERNIHYQELNMDEILFKLSENDSIYGFLFNSQIYLGFGDHLVRVKEISSGSCEELTERKLVWRGFDLKSVWHEMRLYTCRASFDSLLGAYVLKSQEMENFDEVYKLFLGDIVFNHVTPQEVYRAHLRLEDFLMAELDSKDREVLLGIETPLVSVLLKMESKGIRIDSVFLKNQSMQLQSELANLEKEIHALVGEDFNIASPKQLANILFNKMQLPAIKKTKTGFSTDNEVLEKIDHPLAKLVLQYREIAKIKSTYVDALPSLVNPKTGRVHTHFNQAVTTTGRLSSTQPNLQNIPIRTEKGRKVRKAFIAEEGKLLLSLDYSQIELRILAHYSGDPGLCRAFNGNLDVHAATAAEVFGVALEDVTSEQRRSAKAVNFGLAYGQGAHGLAETLGIGRKEAQVIIDRYFEKFEGVKGYIQSMVETAHSKGYVETLFGRKRYIPQLKSSNPMLKKFGERAATNAPMQGTASDIVKMAMLRIDAEVELPMLLQVHDELVFEGSEKEIQLCLPKLVHLMEEVVSLRVPLKVNYAIGLNWDEAH